MNTLRAVLAIAGSYIVLITATLGAIYFFTPMKVHLELKHDFEALAMDVKQDRIANRIWRVQQQIWAIQNNFGCYTHDACFQLLPEEVKGNYKWLIQELERLQRELKK
jgi:hypothetical protein